MKILFINPARSGQGNIPLNIPLLIAVLKENGHAVKLFDFSDYEIFDDKSYEGMFFKPADFDDEEIIKYRKAFYKEDYGRIVEGRDLRKADYRADFEEVLKRFRPDMIAVSCLSVDYKFITEFLLPFKKRHEFWVIFGGIHTVLLPEDTLDSPVCDFVCVGEGEYSLPILLDAIENEKPLESVNGIWFKKDGEIIKNPHMVLTDLSKTPVSDYDCFDPIHFFRPFDGVRYKMLNYEFSRGCPFRCSYCVNGVLQDKYRGLGKYHRVKDVERSIEELKLLIEKYKFNFVRFWDEDFTAIKADVMERYASRYIEEINLPSLIYARVESITEEKVRILKKMRCVSFAMGIESGSERIRKEVLSRHMTNETIINKFKLVSKYKIRTSAYNMIGLPYEKREDIFETIELNRKVYPDSFSVTMLEPYQGTPIRKMCEDQGLDPDFETVIVDEPQFVPKGMTAGELKGLFRIFPFYIRFPKSRYDDLRRAETDDNMYRKLMAEFDKLK